MSNLEIVFEYTKKIESYLAKEFLADGRGLHTKVNSIEYLLPIALIKKLRWIATIRNNMAHKEGFELDDVNGFKEACESALSELDELNGERLKFSAQNSPPLKLSPMDRRSRETIEINPSRDGYDKSLDPRYSHISVVGNAGRFSRSQSNNSRHSNKRGSSSLGSWRLWLIIMSIIVGLLFGIVTWKDNNKSIKRYEIYTNQ